MSDFLFRLAKPFLHAMEPEKAHEMTIKALKSRRPAPAFLGEYENLRVRVFGLDFPNPLGMAAGFDKNAEVSAALLALGFGFVEAGTVTPKPQSGNPTPRIFRLPEDGGMINRLGFNNKGHGTVYDNLRRQILNGGIVGVNIGANKDSVDRIADYVLGLEHFYNLASFYVVNISSPNTPGLRDLQTEQELKKLLSSLKKKRQTLEAEFKRYVPIVVKIAPDLEQSDLKGIADILLEENVDGVIVSNTTISRPHLTSADAHEAGGLSGRPLFALSTIKLAQLYLLTGGKIPIIGVGGIDSAEAAYEKIRAGASLLELYTGLVYHGPGLIGDIISGLDKFLKQDGFEKITDAVGIKAKEISEK